MEGGTDEEEELEVEPNPNVIDMLIHDEILFSSSTMFDEDFNFLMAFVPVLLKPIEDERLRDLCEIWLDQIVGIRAHTPKEKRERNIYLVNLLLNMGKGVLSSPFDKPPPNILKPGIIVFGGNLQSEVCYHNINLEVEDFAEYSRDSRTFFATKALPEGRGAFGYVAVSLGGGDALWLDCQGNNVDPSTLRKKKTCKPETPENTEMYATLKHVLAQRSSLKDRSELLPYYYGLMKRIREITITADTQCEIYDPVIEKMIEDLQVDIMAEGQLEISEIGCVNKKSWLCSLEKKVEGLMQAAEQREMTLNSLERTLAEHEKEEITFLDVSNAVKPPKLDPILAEAVRDKPSEYNVTTLHRHYHADMVTTFLKLLETEKMHVVNQERLVYDKFVMNLRAEVMNEARFGIQRYNDARKELQRVSSVMRKVEETKTKLLKEVERNSERLTGESTGHEEEHLIDTEIEEAKARLEEAQAKSDKIEGKIAKLHDQIHQFTSEYHKMEEEGKRELDYHLKEISDLREHVGNQDRKLNMLKQKLEQTAHDSVCKHQNSCGSI
nr:uncharacterized protein LOC106677402 isoform X6 [Halyomorpha halys]